MYGYETEGFVGDWEVRNNSGEVKSNASKRKPCEEMLNELIVDKMPHSHLNPTKSDACLLQKWGARDELFKTLKCTWAILKAHLNCTAKKANSEQCRDVVA